MLQPDDRRPLQELLRPPEGYTLDIALGTTFTLDLAALLSVPLSFTLLDMEDDSGNLAPDPMALLESLRRYAGKLAIFCQAGRIMVPNNIQRLYSYLESSVVEVNAPTPGGVFHPKLWALRFTGNDGQPIKYRILCASRNLTFDRCWDTVICLEGDLAERTRAYSTNHPLGDFLEALPGLARHSVSPHIEAIVDKMQSEIRRVDFEIPEPAESLQFWPIGIAGYLNKWPFRPTANRTLVISPFVTEGFLERLGNTATEMVLVSRLDSLSILPPESLRGISKIYFLQPDLNSDEAAEGSPSVMETPLEGLHAKLFLVESGREARLFTGSANATNAAFKNNVEFLVELGGYKSKMSVDTLLAGDNGEFGFLNLLQEFKPGQQVQPEVATQRQLEKMLENARDILTRIPLVAHISAAVEPNLYHIRLQRSASGPILPEGVSGRCWPVNLSEAQSARLNGETDPIAEFPRVTFEGLTSFFGVELTSALNEQQLSLRFVLNLPLILPADNSLADRNDRLLRTFLKDQGSVAHYLYFLLAEETPEMRDTLTRSMSDGSSPLGGNISGSSGANLFESLLQALSHNPERLDHVQVVIASLRQSPESAALVPKGFDSIWEPIWQARQEMRQ